MRKILFVAWALVFCIGGGVAMWENRNAISRFMQQTTLPEEVPYEEIKLSASPSPTTIPQKNTPTKNPPAPTALPTAAATNTLPLEVNLAVPFTPQAPHANWEDPYGDFCEEASALMAVSYLQNKDIPNADFADAALLAIKDFEDARFGYNKDTNAEETATILREHFSYDAVELKHNPTLDDIKSAVANGRVVIAPVAGRELGNPYFQPPGPIYHMIVIKGYTATGKFITHDPGTRRGADFLYDQGLIMNVIHDWRTDGNIDLGQKVVIIAG